MNYNAGYKKNVIESIISNTIQEWINHINKSDKILSDLIKQNIIVTGGCITSLLLGEKPNDYDIYFKSIDVAKKVADFYINKCAFYKTDKVSSMYSIIENDQLKIKIKSSGIASEDVDLNAYEYFELTQPNSSMSVIDKFLNKFTKNDDNNKKLYKVIMITTNAITLSDNIQLITRFTGNPEDIHKYFDFIHCQNYFTFDTGLVLNVDSLSNIMSKSLIYNGSLYPVSAIFRTRKFLDRGWNISAGQLTKIAYDISKLDLDDPKILEEQLIGVDTAYFMEIISILKNENKQSIDRTYLFSLIDRIFD